MSRLDRWNRANGPLVKGAAAIAVPATSFGPLAANVRQAAPVPAPDRPVVDARADLR